VASACRVLSARGRTEDAAPSAGRLSPLPAGRWLLAVTQVFDTAHNQSVRVTRPTVPMIVSPRNVTVKGAPAGRVATRLAQAPSLDCALSRQNHWHLSGWTGKSRGRAASRAIVNRSTVLDLAFQFWRTGPSASQSKPDPLISSQSCGRGSAALTMILQSLIKIVSCETDVVLHPTAVGTLEVEQVHGAFSRHRVMITRDRVRVQVQKSIVKSKLTVFWLSRERPCAGPHTGQMPQRGRVSHGHSRTTRPRDLRIHNGT
jgi:hypothetical protein